MVTTTTPGSQHVSICTCTRTSHHLATSGSTPLLVSPPIASSRLLVSGLPRSLPPLPPSPAPPCLPCIEGRQRAAPHSSFPSTTAPLQTLHIDVWGPARVSGQGSERNFLLVFDDYTRYTAVFPLRSKGEVPDVLIPWIRAVRLHLRERFRQDLPVLRLHSDRGGEFSSDLLRDFCRGEGILHSFILPASPQQNGIAERRVGLVMEVARTSMIHAAAPHFLWPFAVRYAAHQLNLWPFRDTSTDKLSARAIPCVFLGFPPDAPGWQFYHPTSRRVFLSHDVTFDESVPFYCLFPFRSAPPPPLPLFLTPGPPPIDPLPPRVLLPKGAGPGGAEPGGAELAGAEPGGAEPEGVEPGGAESKGAESGVAEPQGTASSGGPAGASPRLSPRPEPLSPQQLREWFAQRTHHRGGAAGAGVSAASDTGAGGVGVAVGAGGTGGATAAGPRGARTRGTGAPRTGCNGGAGGGGAGAGDPAELGGAGAGGTGADGVGVGGAGAGGARAGGTGTGGASAGRAGAGDTTTNDPGAGGAVSHGTGIVRPRPQPPHCLPAPTPYTEQTGGLTERREPESRPASLVRAVRTGRRVPRPRPPPVPGTHAMALCPFSVPLPVPLLPPPESSLPAISYPESDLAHAASPTVSRLLATVVTDPSFESTAASAFLAKLVDFDTACRLDYATALLVEFESASPPSIGGECALGTDVLEDRQEDFECLAAAVPRFASLLLAPEGDPDALEILTPRSYAEAITGPYSSQWQAAMDAEMASWKSTGTYVDEVPPPGVNIVDGMWIFKVKRPPGSPPAFKARYVARGFSQRQGVDYFHTFSPTPKMTTLWVLLHVASQRDYELHSLDFSTAFLQGSLHEEIWLRHPSGFTGLLNCNCIHYTRTACSVDLV
ncbi:unnamed protein product [Closterium sp. NIES-54]